MIVRKKEWMKNFHQFGWQHGKYRPENIKMFLGFLNEKILKKGENNLWKKKLFLTKFI